MRDRARGYCRTPTSRPETCSSSSTRARRSPRRRPGNPVKMSRVADGPDSRLPWLNEHTDEVLAAELGLDPDELEAFRLEGVIG